MKIINNYKFRNIFAKKQAVTRRCCVKKCFQKFRKIHKKTPVRESLF